MDILIKHNNHKKHFSADTFNKLKLKIIHTDTKVC